MKKDFLSDEEVELEIAKLTQDEAVKLARKEQRLKYKRRQQLYTLRQLKKRGKELMKSGINLDNFDEMVAGAEMEGDEEDV